MTLQIQLIEEGDFMFGETVNETAMEVMQEISKKYGRYEILFTCIDVYSNYMPEIGIVLSDDISLDEVKQIDTDYNDLIDKKFDGSIPRDYTGMDIFRKADVCSDWLVDNSVLKVYMENGLVIEKSTREYAKHLTEHVKQIELVPITKERLVKTATELSTYTRANALLS